VKTTLDIPDETFRQVKARAALRGIPLRQFVTEALEEKIREEGVHGGVPPTPPWMKEFGALADLKEENRRIEGLIAEAFGRIEPEDES
jgi:hypothetical protein